MAENYSFDSFFSFDPPLKNEIKGDETFDLSNIEIQTKDLTQIRSFQSKIGSFGIVSKMVYQSKFVAVKSIKEPSEEAIKLFKNEIKIHRYFKKTIYLFSSLLNENICRYIGQGQDFMVLEWLEEGNLLDYVSKRDFLSKHFLLSITSGIIKGMIFIHSKNIIHGDLRAANVLLSNHGFAFHPKITDFGCSKICDEDGTAPTSQYPLEWASPELIATNKSSKYSDVWAFAVCVYEMLNKGERPYKGYKRTELMQILINKGNQLCLESKLWSEASGLFSNCLKKDINERPKFSELKIDP